MKTPTKRIGAALVIVVLVGLELTFPASTVVTTWERRAALVFMIAWWLQRNDLLPFWKRSAR